MISRASWSNLSNADGDSIVHTLNRVLPPLISLLLVVMIGWLLARMIWTLVPAPAAGDAVSVPSSTPALSSSATGAGDVETIAASHLFGEADATPVTPTRTEEPDEDLEDTRLVMTLKGTIASELPDYAVALIEASGNEQKVYAIGDTVSSGATLHSVYSDRIVLDENGNLTNLKLPSEFKRAPASRVRRATSTTRQSANNTNSIQNVVSQNMSKLTDVIRPTPYIQDGQPAGYRVYPGRNRKQFAALGLRPGDIIKDIDGQSLMDPTQAMQIFQSLGDADQVTVTVERDGQPETLVLKTSQLEVSGEQTK